MKLINLLLFYLVTLLATSAAWAHGSEGDHSHDEAPAAAAQAGSQPRVETMTESFELVGQLHEGELSILIDRYDTNEPVLNAKVEVELNGLKAPAKFHADHGDYAVDDAAFLKALSMPGNHALVFTVTAVNDSDLLEGTLAVAGEKNAGHDASDSFVRAFSPTTWAIAGGLLAVLLTVVAISMLRRKPGTGK